MNQPTSNPLDEIPLAPIPETGPVPDTRIKDATVAREMYNRMNEADKTSARNRALIQGMFDGDPPYDPAELRASGQPNKTNLNFGEAESHLEYAMSGYIDLTNSVETLVSVKTNFGPETERFDWEDIISEEITRTFRSWKQFDFNLIHLCHNFIAHGMGIAYWPDSTDWRFRGAGLDDFKFPRQTLVSEDDLEVAMAGRRMPAWHLYQSIKNPESAEALGWNIKATRQALCQAKVQDADSDEWMRLEAEFKNNDLGTSARQSEVRLVHAWVREFDDTISHYIFTENDCGSKDFLYEKRSAFRSMQQVFVLFPFGLGTNALTHGIRGIGHKIFPTVNASNRLRSDIMDSARLASSLILKPGDEEALNDMALTPFGGHTILNPGVSIENFTPPNLTNSLTPVLNDMQTLMNERLGSYGSKSVFSGGERKTRFEVAAQLEQAAKLSNTSLELYYAPLQRVFQETVRRMSQKNYNRSEPGGREVAEMRLRILKRGVPLEALYELDIPSVRAVRAIGAGSAAARSLALSTLEEMAPAYDELGQHNLRRDRTIATVGVAQADRYIPKIPNQRPPVDYKLAELENGQLLEGFEISILPNENHLAHVEVHIAKLTEIYGLINAGEISLEDGSMRMLNLFNHTAEQLSMVAGDPITVQKAAAYRQSLQQIGEVVTNGMKKVEAQERKAKEEAATNGGAAPEEPNLDQRIKYEKHIAELTMRQDQQKFEQNLKIANYELARKLADVKAATLLEQLRK